MSTEQIIRHLPIKNLNSFQLPLVTYFQQLIKGRYIETKQIKDVERGIFVSIDWAQYHLNLIIK